MMSQENKKISFGFTKSTKKNLLFDKPPEKNKIQLIDCLESQTIKIKNAHEEIKGPLIIPMVQSTNILDRRREAKNAIIETTNEKPESELTVDELAARELIREAQNKKLENIGKKLVLPVLTENVIEIEGKAESTLEDYELIPISDYGMAMLRGMGWSEGMGIGKSNKLTKTIEPSLRPKGMGLGASIATKNQTKPVVDKEGKEMVLQKGCFAKIVDGKKKGYYCEVQGFDDQAGRVIVKLSLDGSVVNINEFFVVPVTKEEYSKSSKVINIQKYEQYKDQENNINKHKELKDKHAFSKNSYSSKDCTKKQRARSSSSSSTETRKIREQRRYSSSSNDDDNKCTKSTKKHYKSNTQYSKDYSNSEKRKSKKNSKKYSSSSSSAESDYERRDKGQTSNYKYSHYKKEKSKSEKDKYSKHGQNSHKRR